MFCLLNEVWYNKKKKTEVVVTSELIVFILTMLIYLALSGVFSGSNNQKFGDGKNRYDFKDYVDDKADKYNK